MTLAPALLLAAYCGASDEFEARVKTGLESMLHNSATQAELSLRQAVKMSPDSADAHALLALSLIQGHKRPEALAEYKTAIRLDRRFLRDRPLSRVAKEHKLRGDIPELWDLEQQHLLLEILNEPKDRFKGKRYAIKFPEGWVVDGNTARPPVTGSHAAITASGGRDGFSASDAYDWFQKTLEASPERYKSFRLESKKEYDVDGASGMQLLYVRALPGFREKFKVYDLILLKEGEYRRAMYEAPLSEWETYSEDASESVKSLQF